MTVKRTTRKTTRATRPCKCTKRTQRGKGIDRAKLKKVLAAAGITTAVAAAPFLLKKGAKLARNMILQKYLSPYEFGGVY